MPAKSKIPRGEFLQLAHQYQLGRSKVSGWYLSEKLDGTRCFWDGGLTRNVPTDLVPWASVIDPKTGKPKKKIKPVSTGLWSRYGNPIIAPNWFLDQLPPIPLDGELWAGRGQFQLCRSICGGDTPDPRFEVIRYAVYGCPPIDAVLQTREIKNSNFHAVFNHKEMSKYISDLSEDDFSTCDPGATFEDELQILQQSLPFNERVYIHPQIKLPMDEDDARDTVEAELEKVLSRGGEGVIIRDPNAEWTPKRVHSLLKYKPYSDDEGVIVGFTSGRLTDKGSKHLGKIGALILDYKGKRLELSGLTDEEREFVTSDMTSHASEHPGIDMPSTFQGKHFRVGQKVTFRFRELTDDQIPKEARYWRKRDDE